MKNLIKHKPVSTCLHPEVVVDGSFYPCILVGKDQGTVFSGSVLELKTKLSVLQDFLDDNSFLRMLAEKIHLSYDGNND